MTAFLFSMADKSLDRIVDITLTDSTIQRVLGLIDERGLSSDEYGLRFFVQAGGCSGFSYGMSIEIGPQETDLSVTYEHEGTSLTLFVDPTSYELVKGSRIDYQGNLMGGGYKVDNPNAKASCGCGHSFQPQDSDDGCD